MFLQVSDSPFYDGPRQEAFENLAWQKDLECHLVLCQKLLTEFCCLIPSYQRRMEALSCYLPKATQLASRL